MFARLPSFVLGFHGCDQAIGEAILAGQVELRPSTNPYDWLGGGSYFWENDPERALDFAKLLAKGKRRSASSIKDPFVIGAVLDLGDCLNLLDHGALGLLPDYRGQACNSTPGRRVNAVLKTTCTATFLSWNFYVS